LEVLLGSIALAAIVGLAIVAVLISSQAPQGQTQQHAQIQPSNEPQNITDAERSDDRIARYTLYLAVFSGLLLIVAVFQIWLLLRAETVAEKSANAANKSAEIAERALIAGERAFISVTFQPSANIDVATGNIIGWSFTPVWYNSGNTPTRDMQNHISRHMFVGMIPKDWDFPDAWASNSPVAERVPIFIPGPPKGISPGQTVGVTVEQMREVVSGKKTLYMWGWATDSDVFPQTSKHVTRFAIQISAGGDPTNKEKMSFSYPYVHKYNCSDEECERQGYPASWMPRDLIEETTGLSEQEVTPPPPPVK
jgi:hypothetical protein